MGSGKVNVVSIEDRIPKLKQQRRKKANRRLIFLLLLFFILIAFILYFQSPLSHVKKIAISGNQVHSEEEIISITGITSDTNIWKVKKQEIEAKLKELPEMKKAEVKIRMPNTIAIKIQEFKRISYIADGKSFLPVLDNGKILKEKTTTDLPLNAPILFSFTENNVLEEMIKSLEQLPVGVLNSISEIHYDPKETDAYHILAFMNDGNEVSATIRTFAEKMSHYPSIISQLDPNQKGVINLEVGSFFRAYELEGVKLDETEEELER
ncbi:FtsQ-type POTRA domain-containing protein [Bacillus sp. V3B]|uniref:cell division protein FtsQ/DivIB n=1 Tax=Bacillus sp. V3B TaxID=2804915 RepID=UPI00210AA687|nr:FtsQ-type POTRA domain-containing protein [Bacillus sp. V3B]MCQ6274005.1 FtsQ-type POTRA domain-containing protein [Bacillus sp. V3B]